MGLMQKVLRAAGMLALALALCAGRGGTAEAAEATVAVAANFTEAAKAIVKAFETGSGHTIRLSFGATGQFYAQIRQEAPFAAFLSADSETPTRLVAENLAVAGSQFTYAVGRLVLWSAAAERVKGEETLRAGGFSRLAIANPATAPYGAAAMAVLKHLGLEEKLQPLLVQGNNIAQTYQFVETGNAELGFVALAQVAGKSAGSRWLVPATAHPPLRQDAVLLKAGVDNPAAVALLAFLKGPEAAAIMASFGYEKP